MNSNLPNKFIPVKATNIPLRLIRGGLANLSKGNELGVMIRRMRQERGLSREKLADLVGYEQHTSIYHIEAGHASIPLNRLTDFATAFQVDPYEFFLACTKTFEPLRVNPSERPDPMPRDVAKRLLGREHTRELWEGVRAYLDLEEQVNRSAKKAPKRFQIAQGAGAGASPPHEPRAAYGAKKKG